MALEQPVRGTERAVKGRLGRIAGDGRLERRDRRIRPAGFEVEDSQACPDFGRVGQGLGKLPVDAFGIDQLAGRVQLPGLLQGFADRWHVGFSGRGCRRVSDRAQAYAPGLLSGIEAIHSRTSSTPSL